LISLFESKIKELLNALFILLNYATRKINNKNDPYGLLEVPVWIKSDTPPFAAVSRYLIV
jgi:hypothetical protein